MSDSKSQMDQATKEALEASITKWKQHAVATVPPRSIGTEECPLCELFFWGDTRCQGCPVHAHSGISYCMETPFEAANRTYLNWKHAEWPTVEQQNAFHRAAKEEVEFLESLRKYK